MQNLADLLCMDFQVKKKHMDEVLSGPFLWELAPCGANANNEHGSWGRRLWRHGHRTQAL